MGTRKLRRVKNVNLYNEVDVILAKGNEDFSVYQVPKGIKESTMLSEDGVNSLDIATLQEVSKGTVLSTLAPWGFEPGELHFVLVPLDESGQEEDKEDTLAPLPSRKPRFAYFDAAHAKPPSSEGLPAQFRKAQANEKQRIFCGRPDYLSTPPSLLDETLCKLSHDIRSITPTPKDIQCFQRLRTSATQTFLGEDDRRDVFAEVLSQGGILPQYPARSYIDQTGYHDDGDLRVSCSGLPVLYYVQEVKHEVGTGHADPYVEAIHYWLEQIRHTGLPHADDLLEKVNFPAVLVMHFGPYLAIAAAAYGRDPNVEELCCIPLHVHPTNCAQLEAGVRALAALRVALHTFRDRYPAPPNPRGPQPEFPFRDYYEDVDGHRHTFTYIAAIESKRIFRVEQEDGTLLCVKFSKRYSVDAHRVAHAAGFAPMLHAVNMVYGWTMVVMDDMSAGYSTMCDLKRWEKGIEKAQAKPAVSLKVAQEKVIRCLALLHQAGYVHGDVRDVNVLVRNKDAPPESEDVQLVDWDWSGEESTTTYPYAVNPDVQRPQDALSGMPITVEHDQWMAERLLA
ncbi:hypothetical protein C8Q74DRAFT_295609 [Fomes fomentarius]|nr:hypothetical protein C8Q74DRAFT_295609 [Fomes fomentarius]